MLRVHNKQRIAVLFAAGLIFLFSACSASNPSDALRKELKTIVSWIETTRAVGEAWKNGSVPSAYAARTFETAQRNLQQEMKTLQSLSIPEATRADLSVKIQQLQNSLGQAAMAIKKNDQLSVERVIIELTTAQQWLHPSTK